MTDPSPYHYPEGRILVFTRAPVAGSVKTRLAAGIGAEAAAQLHRQLVRDTFDTAVAAQLAPIELHVTPDAGHPFFVALARQAPVALRTQQGTDLGERMHAALQGALVDSEFALLIGTDCPVMTATYLERACRELRAGRDLVLGPTEDGGYVLIGARGCWRELFDALPWGTDQVLRLTRERAQSLGLRYAELPVLWDIDTPADLERWRRQERSPANPHTTV